MHFEPMRILREYQKKLVRLVRQGMLIDTLYTRTLQYEHHLEKGMLMLLHRIVLHLQILDLVRLI